jgi:hypothetical protein
VPALGGKDGHFRLGTGLGRATVCPGYHWSGTQGTQFA